MIITQGIKKSYGSLQVLKGIDLEISKSEVVSIVGASGAGKSTLLHIIGTLDKPDEGSLIINGIELKNMQDKAISAFRNQHIGFVFQFHHLLPEFSALENVSIPGFIGKKSADEVKKRARKLLEMLGLEDRLEHKPGELSGGEQLKRIAQTLF